MVARLRADEDAVSDFFEKWLRTDRLSKYNQQLADIRDLLSSDRYGLTADSDVFVLI